MAGVDYLAVKIYCSAEVRDILVAELSYLDYDSMMETEDGLEAYIDKSKFDQIPLDILLEKYNGLQISYEVIPVVSRNWNEEWEKNYEPIKVENKVYIRATFHEAQESFPYEIIIDPRMSFGTGHHATTYLMIKNQLDLDHRDKRVLDAGTGTGILAIMAEKLGAKEVVAYDNNAWSIENAPSNVTLNHCQRIQVMEGTIGSLNLGRQFDLVLANINKNVLLEETAQFARHLPVGGTLVLSGFYQRDDADITLCASAAGLTRVRSLQRNDWSSLVFVKK